MTFELKKVKPSNLAFGENFWISTNTKYPIICSISRDIYYIAERILTDFRAEGLDKETLLVYCIRGKNRSPAVGMALNEVFGLGYNPIELRKQFPETNWYIYGTLMDVAGRLG